MEKRKLKLAATSFIFRCVAADFSLRIPQGFIQIWYNLTLDQERNSAKRQTLLQTMDDQQRPPTPGDMTGARMLEAHIHRWIAELPERQREAFRLNRFDGLTYAEIASVMGLSIKTVDNHIWLAERKTRPDRASYRRRSGRLQWSLAGLAVVVVVGVGLAQWRQPVTIHAPAGTTVTATLPDGSRTELNSGSTLAYQRRLFGWTQTLRLDGEAFFEVVRADEPFVVETFNAAVAVLGTRFNVRAWPGDDRPETVVVLQSGAVQLAPLGVRERPVHLEPGQMSRLPIGATRPSEPQHVSVDRALAWRSGGLVLTISRWASSFRRSNAGSTSRLWRGLAR